MKRSNFNDALKTGISAWVAAIFAAMLMAPAASAQDVDFGFRIFKGKAECWMCHGWAADGLKDDPRSPPGPSLRETAWDEESLTEVIMCGRPGGLMPYHDKFAYTDTRCYGIVMTDLPVNLRPPMAIQTLQKREVAALVAYLMAKVVMRGEVTLEECIEYWGDEGAQACQRLGAGS
jgi:mono/diheme cytochrome c family protein